MPAPLLRKLQRDLATCPDAALTRLVRETVGRFRDASTADRCAALTAIYLRLYPGPSNASAFQLARDRLRASQRPLAVRPAQR